MRAFLEERLAFAVGEGIAEERVWLDPGIGFGKTVEHNLELLRRLDEIVAIGRPVVVGTSRKSFLGKLAGGRAEDERLPGHDRDERDGARARRLRIPRARRRARSRMPWRSPLLRSGHDLGARARGRVRRRAGRGRLDDDRQAAAPAVTIEISGLSLYTRHGVHEAERELGQRLVFDISFELDECDATVTDRVEDTIDYGEVCEQVALAAQERSYNDARAALHGGRRPADRPLRRRVRARQGRQARAADPAARGRGVGGGLEGSLSLGAVGYLGLGSNEGDRLANLRAARAALGRRAASR